MGGCARHCQRERARRRRVSLFAFPHVARFGYIRYFGSSLILIHLLCWDAGVDSVIGNVQDRMEAVYGPAGHSRTYLSSVSLSYSVSLRRQTLSDCIPCILNT